MLISDTMLTESLIQGFRPAVTDELCAIPAEKIKEVRFKPDNSATDGGQMVSITTSMISAKVNASPSRTYYRNAIDYLERSSV